MEYFANIIANNRSSRLYLNLVYEKKLLKSISATKYQFLETGVFIITAVAYPDSNNEEIEKEITDGINDFVRNGIKDAEYLKIKNKLDYAFNARMATLHNINGDLFNCWFFYNDTGRVNSNLQKYLSVRKDDIIESVKKYLFFVPKLLLTYLPKN